MSDVHLYMCPHTTTYMRPHTCLNTPVYLSSYYYICVLIQCDAARLDVRVSLTWINIYIYIPIRAYVSIREHTWAYVSIREHTWAYVSVDAGGSACVSEVSHIWTLKALFKASADCIKALWTLSQGTCDGASSMFATRLAYVGIRQHTSAYVSIGTWDGASSMLATRPI
jgi:hypothetical protein